MGRGFPAPLDAAFWASKESGLPNFPPGGQFSGRPALTAALSSICLPHSWLLTEGLGELAVGPSCSSEAGERRAESAVFRPTGMRRIHIGRRSAAASLLPIEGAPGDPLLYPAARALILGSPQRLHLSASAVRSRGAGPSSLCPELQLGLDRRKFVSFKVISFCNGLAKKDVHKDTKKEKKNGGNRK